MEWFATFEYASQNPFAWKWCRILEKVLFRRPNISVASNNNPHIYRQVENFEIMGENTIELPSCLHTLRHLFWGTLNHGYNHGYNHWTNPPFLFFFELRKTILTGPEAYPERRQSGQVVGTIAWGAPLSSWVSGTGGCCIRYGYSWIIMGLLINLVIH